jgi:hypothetical protein
MPSLLVSTTPGLRVPAFLGSYWVIEAVRSSEAVELHTRKADGVMQIDLVISEGEK